MSTSRRTKQRIEVARDVLLLTQQGARLPGETVDLSSGGACVCLAVDKAIDGRCHLLIDLEPDLKLSMRCTVVAQHGRYVHLHATERHRIKLDAPQSFHAWAASVSQGPVPVS